MSSSTLVDQFKALPSSQKMGIGGGVAAVIALVVALSLGSSDASSNYKVLFSNVADKDGGAITAALQQANIPYKAEPGGVITVPADKVYDTRLKLAGLGLPKGGTVGFELLDNQKFGLTQFAEEINYRRAVEGELIRSIEAIQSVESARLHLAIPKSTVFVRDQEKPTASVVLSLYSGRTLDQGQVAAIVHLVAASVPSLQPGDVTVVDQRGNLLTSTSDVLASGLDPSQLAYLRRIEADFNHRIEAILKPIVGENNVHAEVTADLDFSQNEQTAETYKPNTDPAQAAIRSEQLNETRESAANEKPQGVPGAQSNQPGVMAPAIVATTAAGSSTVNKTVNYEVDKTIRASKEAVGTIKRLTAAVVINYKSTGKAKPTPLTPQELAQINALIKEAIGFNAARGDSLNAVNAAFVGEETPTPETAKERLNAILVDWLNWLTQHPMDFLRYGFTALLSLYVLVFVVRPVIKRLTHISPNTTSARVATTAQAPVTTTPVDVDTVVTLSPTREMTPADKEQAIRLASYAENLESVRRLAQDDPRVVAQIIRGWLATGTS